MATQTEQPHLSPTGPLTQAEWRILLKTAPRAPRSGCDTSFASGNLIQVCTASDGRPIYSTVAYAECRALRAGAAN